MTGQGAGAVIDYVKALAQTMMEAHDRLYVEQANYARTIPIPTLGVGTTEFDLSKERALALFDSGRWAAEKFLDNWDFEAYIAEFRTRQEALAPGGARRVDGLGIRRRSLRALSSAISPGGCGAGVEKMARCRSSCGRRGGSNTSPRPTSCRGCAALCRGEPAKSRSRSSSAAARRRSCCLNKFPYSSGHLLLAPYAHLGELERARRRDRARDPSARAAGDRGAADDLPAGGLQSRLEPRPRRGRRHPDHVHLHVVPRWAGDTSFMPVLGDVKVMPEHLHATRERLRAAWPR